MPLGRIGCRKGEILNEPFINSDNYRIEFENFEQTTNSSHQIVAPTFAIETSHFTMEISGTDLVSKHTRMSFSIHLMEEECKIQYKYFSLFQSISQKQH